MMDRPDEGPWRTWWRRGFAAFLAAALVVGLYLSFQPGDFDDEPDLAGDEEPTEPVQAGDEPGGEADPEPEDGEQDTDEAEDEDEDEVLTQQEREALIGAARDPAETSVQVLDAGGGSDAANDAADVLRDLGYDVVAVNSARDDYPVTTVLYTEGNADEAEALRARERRVAETAPNDRLSDAVDLHVVVGADWS